MLLVNHEAAVKIEEMEATEKETLHVFVEFMCFYSFLLHTRTRVIPFFLCFHLSFS